MLGMHVLSQGGQGGEGRCTVGTLCILFYMVGSKMLYHIFPLLGSEGGGVGTGGAGEDPGSGTVRARG